MKGRTVTEDGGELGWTVGDLRKALDGVPDSLPINVNVSLTTTHGERDGFIPLGIDSGGISMSDIGEESAPEPYSFLELNLQDIELGALLYVPYPPT